MAGLGRIPDAALAALLHRLSIAVAAGVDLRRVWASEAGRAPARWRATMARVAARLDAGDGFGESCAAAGGAIPDVVAGMLAVGDRTGRLAEVLEETSRAITRSLALRRTLRAASLAAHAGLGIGEMVALASRAAPGFACAPGPVEQQLRSGSDLAETLAGVVGLPRVVTEAVAVGEATGTTAEALDRVADHLDEASARGFAAAVQALGFAAWAVVAGLVVTIVVGVVGGYARMIEGLARPR